jgi:hypothetical protein
MQRMKKKEILKNNPKTDKAVVDDFNRLETKLKRLGVSTSSRYSVASPLGDSVVVPRRSSRIASLNKKKNTI